MSEDNLVSCTDDEAKLAEYANKIRTVGKRAVFEIGKILIAAKARARHGRWLLWLEREFGWTDKTAQRMMSVAAKSDKLSNLTVPVSALYLLAAESTPAEVIEAIAEHSEQGERLSLAEVKKMIAEAEARDAHEDVVARTIEYEIVDEEPPQAREINYVGRDVDSGLTARIMHESDADYAWRTERKVPYYRVETEEPPVRQVRHQVETTRERVVVPYYVPTEQPAPRTIEDFRRDHNRGRAEALARYLEWVERILDEDDTGAIIEALSDEERDQARRVVDKLGEALGEDEMNVEVPDQRN